MSHEDREPRSAEWREVQEQRYNKGFYPQSGKINPFFSRMGAADRRFGRQLLVAAAVSVLLGIGAAFYEPWTILPFGLFALICVIGGVQHLRMTKP